MTVSQRYVIRHRKHLNWRMSGLWRYICKGSLQIPLHCGVAFDATAVSLFFSTCPGGEIGRRNGLKIRFPARECGFKSRPGHQELSIILVPYILLESNEGHGHKPA